jgi:hypothetical protein
MEQPLADPLESALELISTGECPSERELELVCIVEALCSPEPAMDADVFLE